MSPIPFVTFMYVIIIGATIITAYNAHKGKCAHNSRAVFRVSVLSIFCFLLVYAFTMSILCS
ncbi:MAG: hypothetical protein FWC89_13200 [Defluviitaleaceae bacterium]|nr:hypothetical protein [Defluviitaleaceae bacterium]